MKFRWSKNPQRTYLMDENVKMSEIDILSLKNCNIINSTTKFEKGTLDETLTVWAKKEGCVIVTKDIRMTLRSLIDAVPVIYVNDGNEAISFLHVQLYGRGKYLEMYKYLKKRFGYK